MNSSDNMWVWVPAVLFGDMSSFLLVGHRVEAAAYYSCNAEE